MERDIAGDNRLGRYWRDCCRFAWCAAGAGVSLGLVLWAVFPPASPFFLASLGGSTIFLFGLTRAAAAQPRALVGGHLGGAFLGILCYQCFGDALWIYGLAASLTLVLMLLAKIMHPPAGATPLIMVYAHANFGALWRPVGLAVLLLMLAAALWTRLTPGMVRYTVAWIEKSPPTMWWGGWDD